MGSASRLPGFRSASPRDAVLVGRTVAADSRSSDNLLIRADALNALVSLSELPEFTSEYVGRVRLAYIDPPFNTGQAWRDLLERATKSQGESRL